MKRILFYYDNFCGENSKGGTEVATFRIAKALKDTGDFQVYQAFRRKHDLSEKSLYSDIIKLSSSYKSFERELKEFITKHDIEIVVNMSRFFRHKVIVNAIQKSSKNVKVIFMQHFAPGSEIKKPTFTSGFHLLRLNPLNPVYWLRSSFYPLVKLPRQIQYSKKYREVYEMSDKVVLLSEGYVEDYCKIGRIYDASKFVAIPNIYETSDRKQQRNKGNGLLPKKEKRVLILSRLDEIQKRLSLALKIWSNVEKDPDLSEWYLDIVGTGHNADIVKRTVKKLGLNKVSIHGWQSPEPYLRRSSILMMTSEYEGLPLSILEAQSYGCVPIAFDSFASLRDVVKTSETGVIVDRFGDIDDYTEKLKNLMHDDSYREKLSRATSGFTYKFSPEAVTEKWLKILI